MMSDSAYKWPSRFTIVLPRTLTDPPIMYAMPISPSPEAPHPSTRHYFLEEGYLSQESAEACLVEFMEEMFKENPGEKVVFLRYSPGIEVYTDFETEQTVYVARARFILVDEKLAE